MNNSRKYTSLEEIQINTSDNLTKQFWLPVVFARNYKHILSESSRVNVNDSNPCLE